MPDSPQAQLPSFRSVSDSLRMQALQSLGKNGNTIIQNTSDNSPTNGRTWGILSFLADTVIAEMDFGDNPPEGTYVGITFPKGFVWYQSAKRIKLSSGSLVAYYNQ